VKPVLKEMRYNKNVYLVRIFTVLGIWNSKDSKWKYFYEKETWLQRDIISVSRWTVICRVDCVWTNGS